MHCSYVSPDRGVSDPTCARSTVPSTSALLAALFVAGAGPEGASVAKLAFGASSSSLL